MDNAKQGGFAAPPQTDDKNAMSPRAASLPHAPAGTPTRMSVLGADMILLGDRIRIVSQGKLQVDAQIRGDIHAREVVINSGGSVSGQV